MKKRILSAILALLLVLALLPMSALADGDHNDNTFNDEDEVLSIYELTPGEGAERELLYTFTYGELCSMAVEGSVGYMFWKDGWRVCGVTEYVTLDDVLGAAGPSWSTGDTLKCLGMGGYATAVTYEELEKCNWFFPENDSDYGGVMVPASIVLAWDSATVGEGVGETPGEVLEYLSGVAYRSDNIRFGYGISMEQFYDHSAAGARLPQGLTEITIVHPCAEHAWVQTAEKQWRVDSMPTCTEGADFYAHCSVCGQKGDVFSVPALGHDFSVCTDNGDGTHTAACSRCGAAGETTAHIYNEGVCVCGAKEPEKKSYSVAVSADPAEIAVGETADVNLTISHPDAAVTDYNAYSFALTYDAARLTYKSVSDAAAAVTDNNGMLTILGYGDNKTLAKPFTVTFEAKAAGKAAVKLTAANIDEQSNASAQDTPAAVIEPDTAEINVLAIYDVTLTDDFTGESTVKHGEDYTFTAKDKSCDYDFSGSTMGADKADVIDNKNGTFTVKNVTGNLNITAAKTGKTYTVTVTGSGKDDVTAADKATYGTDYSFSIAKEAGYNYTVTVTIGGASHYVTEANGFYTITGSAITGDITINVEKTDKVITETTINFVGTGAADVKGGTSQTAAIGKDFTFEINAEAGYTYTVSLGSTALDPVSGQYTVPGGRIGADTVTVTVEKNAEFTVDVVEYVKANGQSVFLITASGKPVGGRVFAYDAKAMFHSAEYDAYAYLMFSDKTLAEMKTEAAAKITEIEGTAAEIAYTGDVNKTGKTDVNDAQLVWNMYNAKYADFTTAATMEMFLRADMNGSKTLNVEDAAAVVAKIG